MGKKKQSSMFFLAAMTWFGYHCGAGFASGAQVKLYAARYGRAGVIVPLIAWVLCTVWMFIVCEYGRLIKAKSYRDVGATIYWDNSVVGRIAIILWDFLIFMSSITAVGSCVAGCGALLDQLFGVPYWIGCGGFIVVMVLILCFGKEILSRLGKLSTPLVIVFFTVCIFGILKGFPRMVEVLTTAAGVSTVENTTFQTLFKSGMTYGVVQIGSFQALVVMAGKFESRTETVKFAITGFLLNCGAMLFSFFSLMGFYPEIIETSLPTLGIIQQYTGIIAVLLMIGYNFVLVMAYITTAGAMIAGAQARYLPLLSKKIDSELACRLIITLVFIGSATALSTLGLDGILTTVNGFNAAMRKPIWFYPLLILGPIAIHRVSKQKQAEKEEK